MLGGYRVLDLTDGGCLIGGQILGDLGADVIKTWAASVIHFISGDPDRAPTWLSWPCAISF